MFLFYYRKFLPVFSLFFILISFTQCSGSSSSSTDDTTTPLTQDEISTAASSMFLALAENNIVADISADTKGAISRDVASVEGANCDYASTGITGMALSQLGIASTFGPDTDSIPLEATDFCGRGGEWTGYTLTGSTAIQPTCDGIQLGILFYAGQGILRVKEGYQEIYGTIEYEEHHGESTYLTCHFLIYDTGTMTLRCDFAGTDTGTTTITNCELPTVTDAEIETTDTQEHLYLFPTPSAAQANYVGGRDSADFICRSTYGADYSGLNCVNGVRAFISVSADDEIRDMPELYGVPTDIDVVNADVEGDGSTIASNWADLLDGTIDAPLGVNWWSGSTPAGAVAEGFDSTCDGWTSDSDGLPYIGVAGQTDSFWIELSDAMCDQENHLMCLCY